MAILYPDWTKVIDLERELLLEDFPLLGHFRHVANIVEDISTTRQTVIEFQPVVDKATWKKDSVEWIYLFAVDGRIVKLGGTRTGLAGRASSYLCGHHIKERGKSRDCSKTNGFVYNTFDHYLRNGHTIQMWAYQLTPVFVSVDIWGENHTVMAQVYTAYETRALEAYKRITGHYPALSDNSDPNHRSSSPAKKFVFKRSTSPQSPPA